MNCDYVKPIWGSMHSRFTPYIERKKLCDAIEMIQSLSVEEIEEAVISIPKEWGVNEDELDVLIYYLDKRRRYLVKAIEQLEGFFEK